MLHALPDSESALVFSGETAHARRGTLGILQPMQQPASTTSTSGTTSFAGLLAALTSPAKKDPLAWNDDDLADDVATLSYERALRAHSRYRAPDATDRSLTQPRRAESVRIFEATPAEPEPMPLAESMSPVGWEPESQAVPEISSAADRNLKNASITIRLSKAECVQLRKRAAEAGLTVSAYMRSCTFETEALRALVKDTLAQMRTEPAGTDAPKQDAPKQDAPKMEAAKVDFTKVVDGRRGLRQWLGHLWPHARVGHGIAEA